MRIRGSGALLRLSPNKSSQSAIRAGTSYVELVEKSGGGIARRPVHSRGGLRSLRRSGQARLVDGRTMRVRPRHEALSRMVCVRDAGCC